jgi:hypothetical protein
MTRLRQPQHVAFRAHDENGASLFQRQRCLPFFAKSQYLLQLWFHINIASNRGPRSEHSVTRNSAERRAIKKRLTDTGMKEHPVTQRSKISALGSNHDDGRSRGRCPRWSNSRADPILFETYSVSSQKQKMLALPTLDDLEAEDTMLENVPSVP